MTNEKILCVDDDEIILYSFKKDLRSQFNIVTALSGEEALDLIAKEGPFAVILADMLMPGMNGVELLSQTQRLAPDTVRIMLTGDDNKQTAVEAINEGRIFRFLSKPCPPEKLAAALSAGVEQYRLITAERELLEETLNGSVKMLTELLSASEPEAFGRGQKITEYVRIVAPSLGLSQIWDLEVAAMLSHVGLMSIPPTVMQKIHVGMVLTEREREMVTRVPEIGYKVLSKIPRLEPAAKIVLYQNKNFDGSGFPKDNPETDGIPKGARILRILSDLVDLEKKGISRKLAVDQLRVNRRFYDMNVFEAIVAALVAYEKPMDGMSIKLKDLVSGLELVTAVETLDGRLIAPAGTVISPMMLERFHNFAEISGIKEPIFVKQKR